MKVIIIIGSLVFFFLKIAIHIYLESKKNKYDGQKPATMLPIQYFFPYFGEVKDGDYSVKIFCNICYILSICLIILSNILY